MRVITLGNINPRVKKILEEIGENDSVLDVGCVQHSASKESDFNWLHKRIYDITPKVIGIDYLKSEVKKLQNKGYNIKYMDAEKLKLSEKFDVIIAGELIEHLSNPGLFFKGVKNNLKKDGKLILTTPNPFTIHWFLHALVDHNFHCNTDHMCWFCERTLLQLLRRNGFNVTKVEYLGPETQPTKCPGGIAAKLFWLFGLKALGGATILVIAKKAA
ncbi:MAG: class I SAM-dependent methyltransferase [Candidatus Diapherotrites archaeon]|nr:class I SAM-dependent methyltransferase [Candidatus Diapherotrites archaeon]